MRAVCLCPCRIRAERWALCPVPVQVLAWLLGRVGGLRLVRPRLLVPAAALAAATHSADGQPPGGGAPAAPPDTSSIRGGAGTSRTEELRAALEAHWPGSTYPPLLQGRWWRAALAAARDGAREQEGRRNGARGPERGPRRKSVEKEQARGAAAAGVPSFSSEDDLREQLESCVRVAPGEAFEGFFVAAVVKQGE